jgi:dolichol-phosphate mannosyltransferase
MVIVPTFNEAENIRLLVADILALGCSPSARRPGSPCPPIDVVVVDDNSPDGTGRIADELAARYPAVHVIHRASRLGLGTAHVAGFKYGLQRGYDHILTMDADFSHLPQYIPALIEQSLREADLVVGSRYVKGGGIRGCTLPRKAVSWSANAFASFILGLPVLDCTARFRCYRREVLQSIDLDALDSDGYSLPIEILFACQRQGWQVDELPILFENRRGGTSKRSNQELTKALYTVLRLGKKRLRSLGRRPVHGREKRGPVHGIR